MNKIKDILTSCDPDLFENEIKEREEQKATLIGSLYPSIIEGEIEQIKDRLRVLNKQPCTGCGKIDPCICEILVINKNIEIKERELKNLIKERERVLKEKAIEDDSPTRSLFVKILKLYKKWSRRENSFRCLENENHNTIREAIADTLNSCRNDLYDIIEAKEDK